MTFELTNRRLGKRNALILIFRLVSLVMNIKSTLDCFMKTLYIKNQTNSKSSKRFAEYGAVSTPKIKVQLDDMMVDILNTLLCLQDTMVWPHN